MRIIKIHCINEIENYHSHTIITSYILIRILEQTLLIAPISQTHNVCVNYSDIYIKRNCIQSIATHVHD